MITDYSIQCDQLALGTTPADEECAQVGEDDYGIRARAECSKFIDLLRLVFGPEPEGAEFRTIGQKHDYGMYYEVFVRFDPNDKTAVDYAYNVEKNAPTTWIPWEATDS